MLVQKLRLIDVEGRTTDLTGESKNIKTRHYNRLLGRLICSANTIGTIDVSIEHNPDPSDPLGWKELLAFTQQTDETGADGYEDVHLPYITTHFFPHLRAVVDIGGGGDYDVIVDVWFG